LREQKDLVISENRQVKRMLAAGANTYKTMNLSIAMVELRSREIIIWSK
jgi:hypothetical protein